MNKYIISFLVGIISLFDNISLGAQGVDSIRTLITPVQCHGFRNGTIHIDTVFGGIPPYYFSLDGQSYSTNPTFDRLWAGKYTISVRDASGVARQWVILLKEPAALLVKLDAAAWEVSPGEVLSLRAIASVEREFLESIVWMPSDLFLNQDTLRTQIQLTETTQITVQVTDQYGCTDSDQRTIEVNSTPMYIPNAISPGSADNNRYFTVFGGEGIRQIASMQVFNRGGSLIFERRQFPANAPSMGWDGRAGNNYVQPGVYTYLIVVELFNGKLKHFRGTVTVVN